MPRPKILNSRETIAEAAIGCFIQRGVVETTMAHVAKAAGVSRQTVYRFFSSRIELLEFVIVDRTRSLGVQEFGIFSTYSSLSEALVEGSILGMKLGRSDTLLQEIVKQAGEHSIEQFMFRGSDEIQNLMEDLWRPVIDRARETGELRAGVTNKRAVEWIRNIHGLLMLRDDYDVDKQRSVLVEFLVPSLVDQNFVSKRAARGRKGGGTEVIPRNQTPRPSDRRASLRKEARLGSD